ncbi:MAG TPA: sugar kinase [Chthoniobacter sp.]|jgi:NAD kinase
MNRLTENKIVLVVRATRLANLRVRFATKQQARFYVKRLGADFSDYEQEDETYQEAIREAQQTLSEVGRVQVIQRSMLPNFVFGPEDTVVTLGQDGLVANTIKYLNGQPLVGVNPDPRRYDGQLLPFRVRDLRKVLPDVFARRRPIRQVSMAVAKLNTGLTLHAVNDLFVGPRSHGSARYCIQSGAKKESQSSSGVVVSTGLGSTGWLRSLITGAVGVAELAKADLEKTAAAKQPRLDPAFAWDARHLLFTVREPFPTQNTGATLVFGRVTSQQPLVIESQMGENGVIFSDGIEADFLDFNSGTRATISLAEKQGSLVS